MSFIRLTNNDSDAIGIHADDIRLCYLCSSRFTKCECSVCDKHLFKLFSHFLRCVFAERFKIAESKFFLIKLGQHSLF